MITTKKEKHIYKTTYKVTLIDGTLFKLRSIESSAPVDMSVDSIRAEMHSAVNIICMYEVDGMLEFDLMKDTDTGMLTRIQSVVIPKELESSFTSFHEVANAHQIAGRSKDVLLDMLIKE
jgi:hypothetical protein